MIDPRDVFPAYAVQSVAQGQSACGLEELWQDYWSLQMYVARLHDIHSSDLEELQDPRQRACGICGRVHATNEDGQIPYNCDGEECRMCRTFWSYGGSTALTRPVRASGFTTRTPGSPASARSTWFKKYMTETFSTTSLFDLPPELRMQTLMGMTIARMALEQRSDTDKRVSGATQRDDQSAQCANNHPRAGQSDCSNRAAVERQPVH